MPTLWKVPLTFSMEKYLLKSNWSLASAVLELVGVLLVPIVLAGVDEVLGTKFERVVLLVWRVRDGGDLGAQGVREHHGVMSKASYAYNSHSFAWSTLQPH